MTEYVDERFCKYNLENKEYLEKWISNLVRRTDYETLE